MKLHRDYLFKIGLPHNAIKNTIIDHTRWSVIHEIIFHHEGKFYSATYSKGATEQQDESPWEYEELVECTEVHLVEKTIKIWEKV